MRVLAPGQKSVAEKFAIAGARLPAREGACAPQNTVTSLFLLCGRGSRGSARGRSGRTCGGCCRRRAGPRVINIKRPVGLDFFPTRLGAHNYRAVLVFYALRNLVRYGRVLRIDTR